MSANLYALFRERFPADLSARFLETPGGGIVDYAGVEGETAKLANALGALGVRPGDRVAVQVEKSPEAVLLYLACLRAGAVFLPLNTAYRAEEVDGLLRDAEPALFVCAAGSEPTSSWLPCIRTLAADGSGSLASEARVAADEHAVVDRGADQAAVILYTSGTTGRSKGAVLSHGNLAANARALHRAWGFGPGDVLLHVLPVYHAHGLFVALHTTLLNGSGVIFLPRFDTGVVCDWLPRATVMMGVPTHYVRLLREERFDAARCRGMRLFVSGSAPLRQETFERFRERTGHTILERYGMTETGMNTSNPLEGERVAGSVGPALPGVELRVCDEHGRELSAGEVGGLEVRGPNVFREYWRMPEKTRSEFRDGGWFITGDLARIDERGYVYLAGRSKDLIISGGLNVYPKEVELVLDSLPGVLETAVFGLEDADLGEAVSAAVVCEPQAGALSAEQVIAHARKHLAAFKAPRRVFFLGGLPRNAMGKVQKARLRDELG
ncbi:MAG: AMP-binding protein [Myxococcota bacterium]|nr:AMP-binding protein [Myxococcota bacterium]